MSVREQLDRLDKLRAEGTPGRWAQHPNADDTVVGQYVDRSDDDEGPEFVNVADCRGEWPSNKYEQEVADAALIAAAVNVLPKHTAALRAALSALDLVDEHGCTNLTRGRCSDDASRTRDAKYTAGRWCDACIANDAVTAITEALDRP